MESQGAGGGGGEEEPGKMNPKRGGSGRVSEEENKNKPKLVSEGPKEGRGQGVSPGGRAARQGFPLRVVGERRACLPPPVRGPLVGERSKAKPSPAGRPARRH